MLVQRVPPTCKVSSTTPRQPFCDQRYIVLTSHLRPARRRGMRYVASMNVMSFSDTKSMDMSTSNRVHRYAIGGILATGKASWGTARGTGMLFQPGRWLIRSVVPKTWMLPDASVAFQFVEILVEPAARGIA